MAGSARLQSLPTTPLRGRQNPPKPFTTCKWTRVGPPKGWGLGAPQPLTTWSGRAPQPFTTCKWTRVGGPQPLTTWGGRAPNPSGLEAAEPSTFYDLGWGATNPSPKMGKPVTGPFGPELSPRATPKFSSWCDVWVRLGRIWFGWLDGLPRCE